MDDDDWDDDWDEEGWDIGSGDLDLEPAGPRPDGSKPPEHKSIRPEIAAALPKFVSR